MQAAKGILSKYLKARRVWLLAAGAAVLLASSSLTVLAVRVGNQIATVEAGLGDAERAMGELPLFGRGSSVDLASFRQTVQEGEAALLGLRRVSAPVLWMAPILRYAPRYGGDIGEGRRVLDYGLHLVRAADMTLHALEPVVSSIDKEGSLLDLLSETGAKLEENRELVHQAIRELEQGDALRLEIEKEHLSPGAQRRLERGDALSSRLHAITRFSLRAPQILSALVRLQGYEASIGALSTSLSDPAQLVLGDLAAHRAAVQSGLFNVVETRALLAEVLVDLEDAGLTQGLGATFEDLDVILEAAQSGFSAASLALGAAEELGRLKEQSVFSPGFAETLQLTVPTATDRISEARREVQQGLVAVAPLTSRTSSPFLESVASEVQLVLKSASSAIERGEAYLRAMGYVLGLDEPRTFLLLGQNDMEIRPTGGFIGSVHELVLDRGELTVRRFLDSYDVDVEFEGHPLAPWAFCRYWKGVTCLQFFRDANWSPDFPTSARLALDLYYAGQGVAADGVIAADGRLMAQVVDSIGGVRLRGSGQAIDGSRARQLAAEGDAGYTCGPQNASLKPNTCFAEDLFDFLLPKITESPDLSSVLLQLLARAVAEKHLLVYVQDEELAPLLRTLNWDGHLLDGRNDYLMVVDTNGYSKVHDYIQRDIDYRITLDEQSGGSASLTVGYSNSAQPESSCAQLLDRSCYWNYLRVYIPYGSSVLTEPDLPLPQGTLYEANSRFFGYEVDKGNTFTVAEYQEFDKTELAGLIVPAGGHFSEVTFRYHIPAGTVVETSGGTRRYQLVIQKQPGTLNDHVTVTLVLPDGGVLIEASPALHSIEGSRLVFSLFLDTDKELFVEFATDQTRVRH